ncbi:2,3-bisphosphoglycerate-independent phosphoglycerate mutase [candidate division KSB1 bacterium]|nr:2,3-bisphosphoglycerate-independent phosphoglycerate mutase [Candidatus Aminicenantes bacterium]RQW03584.1 MAG: 2,3-bisphosphoglycerate-independent phosphoglycerate mutase [candidate division KSB1 bacterium]
MEREELFRKISVENDKKMVLLVLDGLGGLPVKGKTELETAQTPNLDLLASESELGLSYPIAPGITPGSGPAHLSLFGYDPLKYEIGRGILEALGVGITVSKRDLAVRGNFATLENGLITDRRAGRISTEKNREITAYLNSKIKKIEDVEIKLTSGEEHRFVLLLSGDGLSDQLSDADPEAVGVPIAYARAKEDGAAKTVRIINLFIDRLTKELASFHPANTCLLRGYAQYPAIPSLKELFKLKTAAIAVYPMYKGLAQLVGMDILETGRTIEEQLDTLKKHYEEYDFFFVHIKKTDSYGEDGNLAGKVSVIEAFDRWLPAILELLPDVLVVTGDHSTPALLKAHSWHPNPVLLKSAYQRQGVEPAGKFSEKTCAQGILGNFKAMDVLPLMMANALKFKKYGA